MQRASFLTVLAVLVLFVCSCSSAVPATSKFPNTPEGVVKKMLDSIEKGDANQYLDSVTPEDRKEPGFFFYKQLAQAVMGAAGLGGIDAANPKVSFRELELVTTEISNSSALVTINGKVRDLSLAMEQDFSANINTIKRDGVWLCSLSTDTAMSQTSAVDDKGSANEQAFRKQLLKRLARLKSGKVTEITRPTDNLEEVESHETREFVNPDRVHSVFEAGAFRQETIASGQSWCQQRSDQGWTCYEGGEGGPIFESRRWQYIIDGTGPTWLDAGTEDQVMESGSYVDSDQEPPCRMYYVTFQLKGEKVLQGQSTDSMCFDLRSYDPVFGRKIISQEDVPARMMEWHYGSIDKPIDIRLPLGDSVRGTPVGMGTDTPKADVMDGTMPKESSLIAVVNGLDITTQDYQKRVKFDWFQAGQVTDPQGTSLKTLDTLVDEQLLREQAQQRGITVSEDEINAAVEKSFGYVRVPPTPTPSPTPDPNATPSSEPTATLAPSPTPVSLEAYEKAKKDYVARLNTTTGMTEADFRKIVELDLLRQKLYDQVAADVPAVAEQVHARHILVAVRTPEPAPTPTPVDGPTADPSAPTPTPTLEPRDDAQALARIIEVQKKLAAGEDFAALALQYSDDPGSKTQGGDLGWFARGQGLVQEFEDAAFSLETGKVSDPVKTQFGYHLIRVDEKDPTRALDAYTIQLKKYEAFSKWLADLRSAAKVQSLWSLDKLPTTPQPPPK
jgi:parvulin-like peptidyl-prolyl isomerase